MTKIARRPLLMFNNGVKGIRMRINETTKTQSQTINSYVEFLQASWKKHCDRTARPGTMNHVNVEALAHENQRVNAMLESLRVPGVKSWRS